MRDPFLARKVRGEGDRQASRRTGLSPFFIALEDDLQLVRVDGESFDNSIEEAEKGGFAARRLTLSNALVREEVQPDSGHSTRCVPMSTRLRISGSGVRIASGA